MLKLALTACVAVALTMGIEQAHADDQLCRTSSSHLLDQLDKGDYVAATADFNQRMKAALSADQLARIWPAVAQQFGIRGNRDDARLDHV